MSQIGGGYVEGDGFTHRLAKDLAEQAMNIWQDEFGIPLNKNGVKHLSESFAQILQALSEIGR